MINIISPSRYKINKKFIRDFAENIFIKMGLNKAYIVNIIFIGRQKMKTIGQRYKGENEVLPVLSFNFRDRNTHNENLLGEIFICYPQAVLLAAEREKTVDNIIFYLIKHGFDNILK